MSVKEELHRLIDGLSEDDARQALEELRGFCAERETADKDQDAWFSILTEAEVRALFDRVARSAVGLSGDEFLRAWDEGTLDRDDPRVEHVAMLIPYMQPAS